MNERALVERFLEPFASLPFDDLAASHDAEVRYALERIGQRIGAHDLEIAAIALAQSLTLITHNVSRILSCPWAGVGRLGDLRAAGLELSVDLDERAWPIQLNAAANDETA